MYLIRELDALSPENWQERGEAPNSEAVLAITNSTYAAAPYLIGFISMSLSQ
jgi:hypothetical protein